MFDPLSHAFSLMKPKASYFGYFYLKTKCHMKKAIIILLIIITTIVLFFLWVDSALKNIFERDYYNLILKDSFENEQIYLVERYKSNNKLYSFNSGVGRGYKCFIYENGFDEFVRNGDKLSKKSGELKIKVRKINNEEKTFTFEIKGCDMTSNDISPYLYYEEHKKIQK
jgi:hypothetical protein